MSDHSIAISSPSFSPAAATTPVPNRPVAARTRLLLEGPVLSTLLRLSAPNVLNLLAIAGMITFDALFLGRLGAEALAGVSLAFPFVMLIQHAANGGVGGGVSSAIARARSAQVAAIAPTRSFITHSYWHWRSQLCFRPHFCSARPMSFGGWAGKARYCRLRFPTQT